MHIHENSLARFLSYIHCDFEFN